MHSRGWLRAGVSAIVLLLGSATSHGAAAQYAFAEYGHAAEPSVIVPRLVVSVQRFTRYRPDANKEPNYGQWSWAPRFQVGLRGPITGGGRVTVEVSKPGGKQPWLSLPVETPELEPGAWKTVSTADHEETAAITQTGVCNFSIVLSNPLENSKKVLYTGKFEVSKYKYPQGTKPGETEFYINHDWLLPTGYLEIDASDQEAPMLDASFWFKGDPSANNPDAYVYYNGKQIFSTKSEGAGRGVADLTLSTPGIDKDKTWFRWRFELGGVRVYRRATDQSANNYTQFFLDKNPGNYEIKVLRDGKLARTLAFSVGEDGKIKNNGIADKNRLSTTLLFVPVQVSPGTDVAFSSAPSPVAFYGNPIKLK